MTTDPRDEARLPRPGEHRHSFGNAHFVELYDDGLSLAQSVRTFVSVGIGAGASAIVIAEPEHHAVFEAELARVVDLDAARAQGLYVTADAAETLSKFMQDGRPDPDRFDRVIGDFLQRAGAGGRPVRVFGEMVAVLWAQGNVAGALALEDLWNDLASRNSFRLFCAYPARAFAGDGPDPLRAVAERHSHVVAAGPVTF